MSPSPSTPDACFCDDYGRCPYCLEREPRVWIRFESERMGNHYIVGDEDGEFARAGDIELVLPYVRDLLYGPGTLKEGGLRERHTAFAAARAREASSS